MYKKIQITRIDLRNGQNTIEDKIIIESVVRIIVNGSSFSSLVCSPSDPEELAVGNLFSEGFIDSPREISGVRKSDDGLSVFVELNKNFDLSDMKTESVMTSGCGEASTFSISSLSKIKKLPSPRDFSPEKILSLFREFNKRSVLFSETGGVHAAALCEDDRILSFREDIGRHNAVDKLIGESLLQGKTGENKFFLFSGRISSEIFLKANRFGVYLTASRSAPTDRAVEMAKASNIRLIGFARGYRLNLYN
ncbi:formate dehydrogenase accessory sulfurtransferase FdhD [candidate division WOR-3 bacterium]|nr:formate dehydrogenase accessory sulfurtransferase FdhD [candidate division WOR-3 bacterium]